MSWRPGRGARRETQSSASCDVTGRGQRPGQDQSGRGRGVLRGRGHCRGVSGRSRTEHFRGTKRFRGAMGPGAAVRGRHRHQHRRVAAMGPRAGGSRRGSRLRGIPVAGGVRGVPVTGGSRGLSWGRALTGAPGNGGAGSRGRCCAVPGYGRLRVPVSRGGVSNGVPGPVGGVYQGPSYGGPGTGGVSESRLRSPGSRDPVTEVLRVSRRSWL